MSNTRVGDRIVITATKCRLENTNCDPALGTGDVLKVLEMDSYGNVRVFSSRGWLKPGMFKLYVELHNSIVLHGLVNGGYGLLIEGGGFVVVFDKVVMHADNLVSITYEGNNAGGIHPPLLNVFLTKCAEIGINVIDDRRVK